MVDVFDPEFIGAVVVLGDVVVPVDDPVDEDVPPELPEEPPPLEPPDD